MSMTRVHLLLSAEERAAFRAEAAREGTSLSEWLRRAARDRLATRRRDPIRTVDELRAFFAACDEREAGVEPDWDEHLAVIAASRTAGLPVGPDT